jgi:hypothetical protein
MNRTRRYSPVAIVLLSGLTLAGCANSGGGGFGGMFGGRSEPELAAPQPVPALPSRYTANELVGRYGLAAFHKPEDQARTEAAAAGQCRQPYLIGSGPTGGVIMHLADQATPEELRLKGSADGKNYIGPAGEAAGPQDREIISFDGRVLLTRWVDPEVQGRYGTSVYVRCGAEGTPKPARPRVAPKPKPRPAT